ncbi:MAG: DUF4145 domain-containing protein [Nitrospirota bacterium]
MFHELDSNLKDILSDILETTTSVRDGIDALQYRATHDKQINLLDQLEQDGYLRRQNDRYRVSLTALVQLDDPKAREILECAELVFAVLKTYYKENQRDHIKVVDLAKRTERDLDEIKECLSYMVEGSWWGSHTTDFFDSKDSHVKPAESILKFGSFQDVINQLREWQANRIGDRQDLSLSPFFSEANPNCSEKSRSKAVGREKPSWFDKLPGEFATLLGEVYLALGEEMSALPSMGMRAVIDMLCNHLVGDKGGFSQKLRLLEEKRHVNSMEREVLQIAVDVGSASAHRGHNPGKDDLNTLLDIVEHILKTVFVLRPASEKLKQSTPSRQQRPQA